MGCQCRGAHAIAPVQGRLCKGACAGVLAQWASRSRSERVWPGRWAVLPQNCGQKTGKTGKTVIPVTLFKKQSETGSGPAGAGQKESGQGAGLSCPRIAAQKQEKQEKTVIPVTLFKKQSETGSGPVGAGQKQSGQGAALSCPRIAAQTQETQEKQ